MFFMTNILSEYMETSPQKFWQYMSNSKCAVKSVLLNGNTCSKPQLAAEACDQFFTSVFIPKTKMFQSELMNRVVKATAVLQKKA